MEALKGQLTILAISHNRAMVQAADHVYQMSGGRADYWTPRVSQTSPSSLRTAATARCKSDSAGTRAVTRTSSSQAAQPASRSCLCTSVISRLRGATTSAAESVQTRRPGESPAVFIMGIAHAPQIEHLTGLPVAQASDSMAILSPVTIKRSAQASMPMIGVGRILALPAIEIAGHVDGSLQRLHRRCAGARTGGDQQRATLRPRQLGGLPAQPRCRLRAQCKGPLSPPTITAKRGRGSSAKVGSHSAAPAPGAALSHCAG